jgi:hypothetical protein
MQKHAANGGNVPPELLYAKATVNENRSTWSGFLLSIVRIKKYAGK